MEGQFPENISVNIQHHTDHVEKHYTLCTKSYGTVKKQNIK